MICLKVKVNPIPYLLAVAMASNIGSACTFIGNPQNVLIGSLSQVPAGEYFLSAAPISFLGLIMLYLAISFKYKNDLSVSFEYKSDNNSIIHKYLLSKTIINCISTCHCFLFSWFRFIIDSKFWGSIFID